MLGFRCSRCGKWLKYGEAHEHFVPLSSQALLPKNPNPEKDERIGQRLNDLENRNEELEIALEWCGDALQALGNADFYVRGCPW